MLLNTSVTKSRGITHIGAYTIKVGSKFVAFRYSDMKVYIYASTGAQVTDIAILVVAADDGVMPQTVKLKPC